MSNSTNMNNTAHTYTSHGTLSRAHLYAPGPRKDSYTVTWSYQQYKAAWPTPEQLQKGMTWDEAIEKNMDAAGIKRTYSSKSSSTDSAASQPATPLDSDGVVAKVPGIGVHAGPTIPVSSANASGSTSSSSPLVPNSPTSLLHAFLKDTTPLPRQIYNPNVRLQSNIKPIGFERTASSRAN
ncbi:hypothetical protein VTL71DRAFT_2227 [Oculimacula yallundae]|uniref:Uncharacterized protein n=1 Tax=Oculimacula yallundae TaxID=86028 RepID=A0ABR4C9L3_9HELO